MRFPGTSGTVIGSFAVGENPTFACWSLGDVLNGDALWDRTTINGATCYVSDSLVSLPCPRKRSARLRLWQLRRHFPPRLSGFSSIIEVAGVIEVLSKALAVDVAPIRVNVVVPSAVKTELLDRLTAGNPDVYRGRTSTMEIGAAAEAAEAYLFCMRSTLATGQGFIVDIGGRWLEAPCRSLIY
ncbi:hypothetical protein DFH06DRAFT_1484376 [Mycena polygramma]|nr:hypothetical protein DFH06DRAFT_1484376 [Mycena polygramma]